MLGLSCRQLARERRAFCREIFSFLKSTSAWQVRIESPFQEGESDCYFFWTRSSLKTVEDHFFGIKVGGGSHLMQSLLQAGCHLTSLLLLRAEHCVAPQLLLHLTALVPERELEVEVEGG